MQRYNYHRWSRLCLTLSLSLIALGVHAAARQPAKEFLETAFQGIAESEYEINWQDGVEAYQSPNRKNNLRFTYLEHGFIAQRRVQEEPKDFWLVGLTLDSFGKADRSERPAPATLAINKKAARSQSSNVLIDYENSREGMHQTFTVLAPQLGKGPLRLKLNARLEGVGMAINEQENFAAFVNPDGEEVMRYAGLKVWDAMDRVLVRPRGWDDRSVRASHH